MHRHTPSQNGYAANKRDDDEAFSQYPHRSDLENKYIWGLQDRNRLYRILGLVAAVAVFLTLFIFPSTRSFFFVTGDADPGLEHFDIETLRYYDLEAVQGTSEGWKREERILLCTPLRDAEPHLLMFFSHLRNFTYPHHLIDLAFLVSDSKDKTEELLSQLLEQQQADPDPAQPYGEISVIHKDFGQKVNQDVESRHGFAAQAGRRKLMAQARNWLLSAALRPYHSWVFWRDADVETCPFTVLEDLMRHDKDVIVPSKISCC
jgi:mannan polymerase II complex ANP1 subunit